MPRFSWLVPPLLGCLVVCVYARVALRVAQLAARLFMWVARVPDGVSRVSP